MIRRPEGKGWRGWAASVAMCAALFSPVARGGAGAADQVVAADTGGASREIRLLALGDVNLGRRVGQVILSGDTLYPFALVADTLRRYDIVFANLESPISEQHGRTEDPRNNMIFTAPPAAAQSLRRGGVTVVSDANNHALDYGVSARNQTIRYLDAAGIAHCGTAERSADICCPAVLTVKGIRLAFFAVTDLMNGSGDAWRELVAPADTGRLLPAIRAVRDTVDFVVVSYHGGVEYANETSARTRSFARQALAGGADIVLGHHPHVPYGIEADGKKVAVHSLGNFVFMQSGRYWTRHSFALAFDIVRDATGTRIRSIHALPLRAGFQPEFLPPGSDADMIRDRVRLQSSRDVQEYITW